MNELCESERGSRSFSETERDLYGGGREFERLLDIVWRVKCHIFQTLNKAKF